MSQGAKLEFKLEYATGDTIVSQEVQAWKSAASKVGVKLDLSSGPFNQVIAAVSPCKAGSVVHLGHRVLGRRLALRRQPDPGRRPAVPLRLRQRTSATTATTTNDANIHGVQQQAGLGPMLKFQNYMAQQLGVLWMPYRPNQLSMIKNSLKGVVQSPILSLTPEDWSFSK